MSNTLPRFVMISDVQTKWSKLSGEVAPTNTFKAQQWELTIITSDTAKAQEMRDAGLRVKEGSEDGKTTYAVNLKRKGTKGDGAGGNIPNTPVKIVDADVQAVSNEVKIGNGSTVNVNLWQYEYDVNGNKGIATSITGVQIVDLIEFKPSGGFSVISAAPGTSNEEPTTDMPF